MMRTLKPVTPGERLLEEFLLPMETCVPAQRIGEIVAGKGAITTDTDLRLCRFVGFSNRCWLRAQAAYDTQVAERVLGAKRAKLKPWV